MSGLCFLVPLTSAVRLERQVAVVAPPRGGGHGAVVGRLTRGLSTLHVIDADLRTPGISVRVHARNAKRQEWGCTVGDAFTVPEWCRRTGAVAGVNGGF